ncbi:hypothetical protein Nepgr_001714 [Nepenthes gracilis]|uniref:DUF4283 domain-containing protein n=1 Tax=Nepenthes gracilis TaxID=150966 RepID=A0AAD3P6I2_NEPGR|nr:hypothetical protein Nepgr_001714 [Nepenthes gracilis]
MGSFEVIDLDFKFFPVRFTNPNDYMHLLENGPWMVFQRHLTVNLWIPELRSIEKDVTSVVVCVRIPSLPLQYFRKNLLWDLRRLIGEPICVDTNTSSAGCGGFEKIAVKIDLSKPYLAKCSVDGEP